MRATTARMRAKIKYEAKVPDPKVKRPKLTPLTAEEKAEWRTSVAALKAARAAVLKFSKARVRKLEAEYQRMQDNEGFDLDADMDATDTIDDWDYIAQDLEEVGREWPTK